MCPLQEPSEVVTAANRPLKLDVEILWNAPVHSWTGVAEEAVDFVVPLANHIPRLGLAGLSVALDGDPTHEGAL